MQAKTVASFCLIASLMAGLAFHFSDQYQPGMINDDAYYYLGAVSLARSGSYLDLTDPGQAPQKHFPPGYSLFLSAFLKVLPENPTTARWVSGALTSLSLGGMFLLGAQLLGPAWAWVATAWMLLLPATAIWSTALISEIPYLALSLALIGLMIKKARPPLFLVAMLGAYLFLIRPIGIALIAAYGVWAALRKDFKTAASMSLLGLALLVAHFFWANSGAATGSHHMQLLDFAKNAGSPSGWLDAFVKKGGYYASEFLGVFIPWNVFTSGGTLGRLCASAFSSLPLAGLLFGCFQPLSGPWGLISLYVLFYFVVHMAAVPSVSGRYLIPVLPFLYCLIASGWKQLIASRRKWVSSLSLWIGLSFAFNIWGLYRLDRGQLQSLPQRLPTETFAWIKASLAPKAIVAADISAPVTLYTGRYSMPFPYVGNPDSLLDSLFKKGAGFILLRESQNIHKSLGGAAQAAEAAQRAGTIRVFKTSPVFSRLYENAKEGTELFKVTDPPDSYRKAYATYQDGETAFKSGKLHEAKRLFHEAIALDARLCDARIYLASFELDAGRAQSAVLILKEAVRWCPGYPLAHLSYAQSLGAAKRFKLAREELEVTLELSRETAGLDSDRKIHRQAETLLRLIATSSRPGPKP